VLHGRLPAHHLTLRQLAPLFGVSKAAADRVIDVAGPNLALRPRKRKVGDQLRVIDDRPDSGTGHQATLRLQPGDSDPQLWYFHLGLGTLRMGINYQEYLDALILTKGTSGWQFLFCDITKELRKTYDFDVASPHMKTMLDVFPELFPTTTPACARGWRNGCNPLHRPAIPSQRNATPRHRPNDRNSGTTWHTGHLNRETTTVCAWRPPSARFFR
jgi:hypothetical protein